MEQAFNFILRSIFFIIFFLIVTPLGLLLRLVGIDYLQRRWDPRRDSYWIEKS